MKKIAILSHPFFDHSGSYTQMGGGERYLIDLVHLLRKYGYYVEIFQCSSFDWKRYYDDVKIIGIPATEEYLDSHPKLTKEFHNRTYNFDYFIYFMPTLAYPEVKNPSILISHGIWWDSDVKKEYHEDGYNKYILDCFSRVDVAVSVDTNTINWAKALSPKLFDKFVYIPNYVDTKIFKPKKKEYNDKFIVLFPRRLSVLRGYALVQQAAENLLKNYRDMEFYFVGRGSPEVEESFKLWADNSYGIRYEWFDMKDMPKAYEQVDIVLIPTLGAEGTSLSCIEAQAFGKPVIASCVGGLSDLVIDGYNGLLIKPTLEKLCESIEYLYHNRDKAEELGKKAREVSMAFSKERWEEKWSRVLGEVFPN